MKSCRVGRVTAAVLAGAAVALGVSASPASSAPTDPVGAKSGLPFDSGVFAHDPARVARYEKVTGRPVDVWQVAPQRGEGFDTMLSETRRIAGETPAGVKLDVATPPVTRDQARALGQTVNSHPGSYYRPGWEFNLDQGWDWTIDKIGAGEYKRQFVASATGFREGCPSCLITWNPNSGQGGVDRAAQAYPGDEYVDVIGVDVYDWANEDAFDGAGGLNEWVAFAREHGKKMSLPEWGVHGGVDEQGKPLGRGDNGEWATRVVQWVAANRDVVVMASYFDEPVDYIRNSVADGQMPQTGEALRASFTDAAQAPAPAAAASEPTAPATGTPPTPTPSAPANPWGGWGFLLVPLSQDAGATPAPVDLSTLFGWATPVPAATE